MAGACRITKIIFKIKIIVLILLASVLNFKQIFISTFKDSNFVKFNFINAILIYK